MKKILVTAALLFAGITASLADNDRPIALDKLPAAAQTFLKTHFADLTLAYAVEDPKFVGSEYEVTYTDRTEVEFRPNGEWSSVERRYAAVPASIVFFGIFTYSAKAKNCLMLSTRKGTYIALKFIAWKPRLCIFGDDVCPIGLPITP